MYDALKGIWEKKCARCGKIFISAPQHMYRYDGKWFCSYTCYDRHLDDVESKAKKGKGGKKNDAL